MPNIHSFSVKSMAFALTDGLSVTVPTFPLTASSVLRFLSAAPAWRSDSRRAVAQTPDTGSAASGPSHTHTHTNKVVDNRS